MRPLFVLSTGIVAVPRSACLLAIGLILGFAQPAAAQTIPPTIGPLFNVTDTGSTQFVTMKHRVGKGDNQHNLRATPFE